MLFVFHGDDVSGVRTAALKKTNELCGAGGTSTLISSDAGSEAFLRDALGRSSLFGEREVFVLDTWSEDSELFSMLSEHLPECALSENAFVIIESKLSAKDVRLFSSHATEIIERTKVKGREFNVFALGDALSLRDKKTLWILLQESWRDGRASEELIGTLFWQLKMIRLTELTKSADEAGQKPFVYDKAKRARSKFKEGEVSSLMHSLVVLYHDGHGGRRNIEHALEAWVLAL